MNSLASFLTSKEIIFVYILAGLACFICVIVYLVERNNEKLRKKHNTRELNKLVEQIVEELDAEEERINYETPIIQSVEVIEDTSKIKEEPMSIAPIKVKEDNSLQSEIEELEIEELEYTTAEPDQETARLELKKIEEELKRQEELARQEKAKEEQRRIEALRLEEERKKEQERRLAEYQAEQARLRWEKEQEQLRQAELKRQEEEKEALRIEQEKLALEKQTTQNIKLTSFEEEQERTAIISMDELLQKSKEMYAANEVTQYKDEGNEPISLQDLETIMDRGDTIVEEPVIIANVISESENDYKVEVIDEKIMEKIQKTDYKTNIEEKKQDAKAYQTFKSSPIISPIFGIENDRENAIELENTANYEKLDEQIKKSNNFIVSLKELQENLD